MSLHKCWCWTFFRTFSGGLQNYQLGMFLPGDKVEMIQFRHFYNLCFNVVQQQWNLLKVAFRVSKSSVLNFWFQCLLLIMSFEEQKYSCNNHVCGSKTLDSEEPKESHPTSFTLLILLTAFHLVGLCSLGNV